MAYLTHDLLREQTMADMLALRDYQHEAILAVRSALPRGNRQAVVLPTGSGKTVIFTHLIKDVGRSGRSLVLVHRDELVTQALRAIHDAAPGLRAGIIKAEKNDIAADVAVASVQTLSRPDRLAQYVSHGTPSLVCVDEAHHSAADTWLRVLEGVGSFQGTPTVGFSATLSRADGKRLGKIWDGVAYRRDILEMIRAGWLTDVSAVRVQVEDLDLSRVRITGGDYSVSQLGATLRDAGIAEIVALAYGQHASGRRAITFCPDVATAVEVVSSLRVTGVTAELITGETPSGERAEIYERFRTGATGVLVSVMVLTEGFDAPWAEVAIIARPTRSPELYTQMVGRVLRPWPGKHSALVLDIVGATSVHRLATLADLSDKPLPPPEDGEPLTAVAERLETEELDGASGQMTSRSVDLFEASHSAWLQTPGGVWFIPSGQELFFLWGVKPGLWNAGRRPVRGRGGSWIAQDVGMEAAMAWCEQAMQESESGASFSIGSRSAAWRTRRGKPSEKQLGLAASLGIPVTEGATKGEVSDLISIKFAERVFDRT